MSKNRLTIWVLLALTISAVESCRNAEDIISEEEGTGSTSSKTTDSDSLHEEDSDYIWDGVTATAIVLDGTSITINGGGVSVSKSVATIDTSGNYVISGTLHDGQIIVNTNDEGTVRIVLNGASITNSSNAPLYIQNAKKAVIELADGTGNYLEDGTFYSYSSSEIDEPNAALFSADDLTIYGNGSLTVKANYNDGISSKDGLIINSGTIKVTSTDDGIRGKDYLFIEDGTITVTSGGDGLKSDNDEDENLGYIAIENGNININSETDGIQAQTIVAVTYGEITITAGGGSSNGTHTGNSSPGGFPGSTNTSTTNTISTKGIKATNSIIISDGIFNINSADDALHTSNSVTIKGGLLKMASGDDGIHADSYVTIDNAEVNISTSYEAIESNNIALSNSNVWMVASDDGFNATAGTVAGGTEQNDGSILTISSGYICVNASGGDAIDSNGNINITGGTVIAHGPSSQPEVGMDYNGTCKVTGGTLIVSGSSSNMTQAPSNSSTQNSVLIYFSASQSASSLIHIQDSEGNDILTFAPVRAYQSLVLSSSGLKTGNTYSIYTGGNSTSTKADGYYNGGNYSGGTLYKTFTVSGSVTTVGSSGNGGNFPGGR